MTPLQARRARDVADAEAIVGIFAAYAWTAARDHGILSSGMAYEQWQGAFSGRLHSTLGASLTAAGWWTAFLDSLRIRPESLFDAQEVDMIWTEYSRGVGSWWPGFATSSERRNRVMAAAGYCGREPGWIFEVREILAAKPSTVDEE